MVNAPGYSWWYIVRRDFVEKHKLRFARDIAYGEDNVFTLRMFLLAEKVVRTNIQTYIYVIHPESVSMHKYCIDKLPKIIESMMVVIKHMDSIAHESKSISSETFYQSYINRRDVYAYFTILRCIRVKKPYKDICGRLEWLSGMGIYPFHTRLKGKFHLIEIVLNHPPFLHAACFFYKLFPDFSAFRHESLFLFVSLRR